MNFLEAFQLAIVSIFTNVGKGLLRLLLPDRGPVYAAGPGGDANALGTFLYMVPCDAAFETTPTIAELGLAACPDDLGVQLALQYIGWRANTLPVDGTNVVTADIEFIDDSDSDTVTNLVAAYNFLAAGPNTALVNNTVFVGWQILDPGDVVNAEFAITTPDTASEGAAFVVMGKILKVSA